MAKTFFIAVVWVQFVKPVCLMLSRYPSIYPACRISKAIYPTSGQSARHSVSVKVSDIRPDIKFRPTGYPANFINGQSLIEVCQPGIRCIRLADIRYDPIYSILHTEYVEFLPSKNQVIRLPWLWSPDIRLQNNRSPDIRLLNIGFPDIRLQNNRSPDIRLPDMRFPDIRLQNNRSPNIR